MTTRRLLTILSLLVALADLGDAAVLCRGKGDRLVVRESCRKR